MTVALSSLAPSGSYEPQLVECSVLLPPVACVVAVVACNR
jgi:hypothetical protein